MRGHEGLQPPAVLDQGLEPEIAMGAGREDGGDGEDDDPQRQVAPAAGPRRPGCSLARHAASLRPRAHSSAPAARLSHRRHALVTARPRR